MRVGKAGPGAAAGAVEAVRLLLAAGASVTATDINGYTPLHEAAWAGNNAAVQTLVEARADVDYVSDFSQETPAITAAGEGHSETVLLLIRLGASVNVRDGNGRTLAQLARRHGFVDTAEALERRA